MAEPRRRNPIVARYNFMAAMCVPVMENCIGAECCGWSGKCEV
jgi:hypothetical protein